MATPTNFLEQNDVHTVYDGTSLPIWVQDYNLGDDPTKQFISGWQLSREELQQVHQSDGFVFLSIIGGQPPCCILSATAVPFEGQNIIYTHPDCYDLPVFHRVVVFNGQRTIQVTSAWQLSAEWREEMRRNGGIVFLSVIGDQPPVEVSGFNPIL